MSLPYNKELISRARELRKNMTRQERRLWYDFLSQHEVRFQRQKVIDNYIVDFYCSKAGLVIELDGSQHYMENGVSSDEERTRKLKNYNLRVLRFSNSDVDTNFEGVCAEIEKEIGSPGRLRGALLLPQSPTVTAPSGRGPYGI